MSPNGPAFLPILLLVAGVVLVGASLVGIVGGFGTIFDAGADSLKSFGLILALLLTWHFALRIIRRIKRR